MSKYNQFPIDWREISSEEFTGNLFHYCTEKGEHRQMRNRAGEKLDLYEPYVSAILFAIEETKKKFPEDGLGIAIFEAPDGTGKWISKFAKFGREEDWRKFEGDFAAQFRGDNS